MKARFVGGLLVGLLLSLGAGWISLVQADLRATSGAIGSATITGGTIDSTVIGGTTPAAGTFTAVTTTTGLMTSGDVLLVRGQAATPPAGNGWELGNQGTYVWARGWNRTGASALPVVLQDIGGNVLIGSTSDDATNMLQVNGPIAMKRSGTAQFTIRSGATSTGLQIRTAQQTVPTCSTNCGTSPSVAGSDTAGIVTMGATGVPASGWVVTFNGTWASAPACSVQMAKAGMLVGKQPLTVVTSTTTMTVVTNGTAPSTTDMYQYICIGVS